MTIEQLNYLLRKELYAIKNHKDNIDRIKKEYFDSNYGLKEGDKIRILHEAGDEMIGFLKKVEVCEDGDLYLTIQKQNEKGDRGRGKWNMYLSSKLIKIENPMAIIKKSLAKTVALGFVADIIATAVLMILSFGITGTRNTFAKWFHDNISIPILNDYYETPWGILVIILAVMFAGFLVYVFNRKFSFKNTDLSESQIKKVSLTLAIITAPYLFLIPTNVFYNLFS